MATLQGLAASGYILWEPAREPSADRDTAVPKRHVVVDPRHNNTTVVVSADGHLTAEIQGFATKSFSNIARFDSPVATLLQAGCVYQPGVFGSDECKTQVLDRQAGVTVLRGAPNNNYDTTMFWTASDKLSGLHNDADDEKEDDDDDDDDDGNADEEQDEDKPKRRTKLSYDEVLQRVQIVREIMAKDMELLPKDVIQSAITVLRGRYKPKPGKPKYHPSSDTNGLLTKSLLRPIGQQLRNRRGCC